MGKYSYAILYPNKLSQEVHRIMNNKTQQSDLKYKNLKKKMKE